MEDIKMFQREDLRDEWGQRYGQVERDPIFGDRYYDEYGVKTDLRKLMAPKQSPSVLGLFSTVASAAGALNQRRAMLNQPSIKLSYLFKPKVPNWENSLKYRREHPEEDPNRNLIQQLETLIEELEKNQNKSQPTEVKDNIVPLFEKSMPLPSPTIVKRSSFAEGVISIIAALIVYGPLVALALWVAAKLSSH
jgi:hypothetical protein